MPGRFIKLYDQILKWEWYHDINTFRLFIHLLLKANYKDTEFKGQVIHRGQLVTSLPSLAADTALTIRQVRVSLNHLMMTGEVTSKPTNKYRVITIVNYDQYQASDRQNGSQMTDNASTSRQSNDRQDDSMYRNIEYIENIEDRNSNSLSGITHRTKKHAATPRFTPPTLEEVREYCDSRKNHVDPEKFFDYYQANGWKVGKNPMKDFKAAVRQWERNEITEREYQEKQQRLLEDLPF